ncbi:MAG: hypothetical protein IH598_12855 [Bacteroidales bacterium]|nr:hypothetical protein [Bacteroidales bacterium]
MANSCNPFTQGEYVSEIGKLDNNNSNRFFLKNPNLNLLDGRTHIILDKKPDYNNPQFEKSNLMVGDSIRFTLKITG